MTGGPRLVRHAHSAQDPARRLRPSTREEPGGRLSRKLGLFGAEVSTRLRAYSADGEVWRVRLTSNAKAAVLAAPGAEVTA